MTLTTLDPSSDVTFTAVREGGVAYIGLRRARRCACGHEARLLVNRAGKTSCIQCDMRENPRDDLTFEDHTEVQCDRCGFLRCLAPGCTGKTCLCQGETQ